MGWFAHGRDRGNRALKCSLKVRSLFDTANTLTVQAIMKCEIVCILIPAPSLATQNREKKMADEKI